MSFILNQMVLSFWNYLNSIFDAYRILKNKRIAHGVNFIAYGVVVAIVLWIARYELKDIVFFSVAAFLNRQLSFDIPLNLRRGLPWYYQSMANPPKALMDRIERKLFGIDYNGKKIIFWYSVLFIFSMLPHFIS